MSHFGPHLSLTCAQKKRGFTLTEIAIVLGIIGTILGAIWSAAAHTTQASRTSKLVNEILTAESTIRAAYASRQSFAAAACINPTVINLGAVSADMINTAVAKDGACAQQQILNPWGDTFDVASQLGWDGLPKLPNAFEILIGNPAETVKTTECQPVLMQLANASTAGAGLIGVSGTGFVAVTSSAAIAALGDTYFNGCSGHFTLQYSLQ